MDKKLLDILCCPSTKQNLRLLSSQALAQLNARIATQSISQSDGHILSTPLKAALITQDNKWLYRIDDGIPVLLSDEAIASAQIADFHA